MPTAESRNHEMQEIKAEMYLWKIQIKKKTTGTIHNSSNWQSVFPALLVNGFRKATLAVLLLGIGPTELIVTYCY